MLPPVDPSVLSSNPRFEALYQDICANRLNEDGSSKLEGKPQWEEDTLTEDLRKARINAAKHDLLRRGLEDLSYRGNELPEELQEVVGLVAAILEGSISSSDRELIQGDVEKFKRNIDQIARALSKKLQRDAEVLAAMQDPENPPSVRQLPKVIQELRNSTSNDQSQIAKYRLDLSTEAAKVHRLHAQVIETSIRILEQTIHGSVARGTKAKADYLAQVAEGMNKKLNLQHAQLMSQLYSPEVQQALQIKSDEIESQSQRARRQIRDAEAKLDEYKASGGAAAGLAAEYAAILKETERVEAEIARLGQAG